VAVFYLIYLTPYMILKGKLHERLDVRTFMDVGKAN
jgi:hypothetical protein